MITRNRRTLLLPRSRRIKVGCLRLPPQPKTTPAGSDNFTEPVKKGGRPPSEPEIPRRAAAALALVASLAVCKGTPTPPPCPRGFSLDETRTTILLAALGRVPEGREVRDAAPNPPRVCFGPAATSVLTSEEVVLLDSALGEAEAAARLGHLLLHVKRGSPLVLPADRAGCAAAVESALGVEAEALVLELHLRRALGVATPQIPYTFEGSFWEAAPEARTELVLAYLRAHPDGAPGLDALAAGYARRCREARP